MGTRACKLILTAIGFLSLKYYAAEWVRDIISSTIRQYKSNASKSPISYNLLKRSYNFHIFNVVKVESLCEV